MVLVKYDSLQRHNKTTIDDIVRYRLLCFVVISILLGLYWLFALFIKIWESRVEKAYYFTD